MMDLQSLVKYTTSMLTEKVVVVPSESNVFFIEKQCGPSFFGENPNSLKH